MSRASGSPTRPWLRVRGVECKTLLHRFAYPSHAEYTANLYKGCTHGCVYCYAPSLTHDERPWGSYVDAKINAPAVLEREIRGLEKAEVFLSSASDPYQPVEANYRLTRRCLDILLRNGYPVSILTRSPLVLRDLDLLKRFEQLTVGMSITTVPARQFEPGVPPLQRRIDTLARLSGAGIRTRVSLAPVIPGIMMLDLERLFEELGAAGVSSVSYGVLRFSGYEESRSMFQRASKMEMGAVFEGREAAVAKIEELIRRHGMTPGGEGRRQAPEASLDTFCARLPVERKIPLPDGPVQ